MAMNIRYALVLGITLALVPWLPDVALAQRGGQRTPLARQAPALASLLKPDLTCDVDWSSQQSFKDSGNQSLVDSDGKIWLRLKLENQGSGQANDAIAKVDVWVNGQKIVDGKEFKVTLPPGAKTTLSPFSFTLPSFSSPSAHEVEVDAMADPNNAIVEVNDLDNTCSGDFEVHPQ